MQYFSHGWNISFYWSPALSRRAACAAQSDRPLLESIYCHRVARAVSPSQTSPDAKTRMSVTRRSLRMYINVCPLTHNGRRPKVASGSSSEHNKFHHSIPGPLFLINFVYFLLLDGSSRALIWQEIWHCTLKQSLPITPSEKALHWTERRRSNHHACKSV